MPRTPRRQGTNHYSQVPPLVCQDIFGARRMVRVEMPGDEPVLFHQFEPIRENGWRNAFEGLLEVLKTACPLVQEISHNEESPAVTYQLERLGHRAGLIIVLWHRSLRLAHLTLCVSRYCTRSGTE